MNEYQEALNQLAAAVAKDEDIEKALQERIPQLEKQAKEKRKEYRWILEEVL